MPKRATAADDVDAILPLDLMADVLAMLASGGAVPDLRDVRRLA